MSETSSYPRETPSCSNADESFTSSSLCASTESPFFDAEGHCFNQNPTKYRASQTLARKSKKIRIGKKNKIKSYYQSQLVSISS